MPRRFPSRAERLYQAPAPAPLSARPPRRRNRCSLRPTRALRRGARARSVRALRDTLADAEAPGGAAPEFPLQRDRRALRLPASRGARFRRLGGGILPPPPGAGPATLPPP